MTERWGMVVDVNRCVGCQTCTVACKHQNDTLPGVQWRRVLDVETGRYPDVERIFLVVGCQHCANPPCVPVCPSGATRQRADGLVTMDYDRCIGCGSCAVACPYQARTIAHHQDWYYGVETTQEVAVRHRDRIGVAQKCSFCVETVDQAKEEGMVPGVDLEYTPACAASCITQAIRFGDFNDPDSVVSRLTRERPSFQMHAELGTDPQIKYLYEAPAIPGRDPQDLDRDEDALGDSANALVGDRQTLWDYRAAVNFIIGGMSSGLAIVAYLAYLFLGMSETGLSQTFIAAAALMAVGLFFVFLKLGRKFRFAFVLLRPQSSWMTRETYAVAVFYPAVGAGFLWPHWALHLIAALAAAVFLLCQARMIFVSKGIPAWRVAIMPFMLAVTGLAEGTGLFGLALLAGIADLADAAPVAYLGIALAVLNAWLWTAYRRGARGWGVPPLSRKVIEAATPALYAIGHAAPAVFYVICLTVPALAGIGLGLASIAVVAGGVFWKATVILRASYFQSFALAKLPQRGSGVFAAPSVVSRAA